MRIKWNKYIDKFYILAYVLPLLILNRYLYIPSFKIDDSSASIYVFIVFSLFSIGMIFKVISFRMCSYKILIMYLVMILFYLIHVVFADNQNQSIYAILVFFIPVLYVFHKQISKRTFESTIKLMLFISFLFSLLYIVSCIKTSALLGGIGYNIGDSTVQTRGVTALGGAISVGTYLNFTLPFNIYFYNKNKKNMYFLFVIANVLATFFTLSRTVTLIAILIIVYMYYKKILLFFYRFRNKKSNFLKLVLLISIGSYFFNTYDFSRITIAINPNQDESSSLRFEALGLGIEIFKDNLILGTGMGDIYHRVYENPYIEYKGQKGLIDPHNGYVLILAEGGIIGICLFAVLIFLLFYTIFKKRDKDVREIGVAMLIALITGLFGGSFIINDPKLTSIIWLYFSLLINQKKDLLC